LVVSGTIGARRSSFRLRSILVSRTANECNGEHDEENEDLPLRAAFPTP